MIYLKPQNIHTRKSKKMSDLRFEHEAPPSEERYHLIRSAIFGHVIGDALGVPVEFIPRQKLRSHPVSELAGGGNRGYPAGTWSDDSSMTLCALESLTERQGYDGTVCKVGSGGVYDLHWKTLRDRKNNPLGHLPFSSGGTFLGMRREERDG